MDVISCDNKFGARIITVDEGRYGVGSAKEHVTLRDEGASMPFTDNEGHGSLHRDIVCVQDVVTLAKQLAQSW